MFSFKKVAALGFSFLLGASAMLGFTTAEALLTFPDVERGAFYETAVKEMAANKFITGYSNGNFGPNDTVTRGQMAVIMNRLWSELKRQGVVQSVSTGGSSTSRSSTTSSSVSSSSSSLATSGNYFRFSVSTLSPLESTPKVSVSVSRIGSSTGDTSVQYETINGTATGGEDFTTSNGTLQFKSGETSKTITVNLKEDTLDEGTGETFTIQLKNPGSGMGIGAPDKVAVTILDNDEGGGGSGGGGAAGPQGKLQFSAHAYGVAENAGSVTVKVVRTDGSQDAVTVEYLAKGNTATSEHFNETSGTLSFANGELEKTFTVAVINNSTTDGYKTVDLFIKNPTGGAVLGLKEVVLTIIDDEITPDNAGKLSFTDDEVSVIESVGTHYAMVKRTSGATGSVSVTYATQDGGASSGSDYTLASGTLTFAAGETQKAIPITIIKDDVNEEDETFTLKLTNPTNNATLISPFDQYITIE